MNSQEKARTSCTILALALAAAWGIGYGLLSEADAGTRWFALIGMLPPVLFAPGVYRGKVLPTALLGFLSLFYMAQGFTELVANPEDRGLASVLTLLSLMLFLSAGHALRLHNQPGAGR